MSHSIDWKALEKLREIFLSEKVNSPSPYWDSEALLQSYDESFGERIRAKWCAVLGELKEQGWSAQADTYILDWGCGTGVAARAFASFFSGATSYLFYDRSKLAERFAMDRLSASVPGVSSSSWDKTPPEKFVLLLSHVLNELNPKEESSLLELSRKAQTIIWVEPGTPLLSRRLIALREKLRAEFQLLAPCPHQERCGLLAAEMDRHWCHHFARPPLKFFQSAFWREFSERLKIDLRSLPVSYLVLEKRVPSRKDTDLGRVLGRARIAKGDARALLCRAEGVREEKILRKESPELYERLKDGGFSVWLPRAVTCVSSKREK